MKKLIFGSLLAVVLSLTATQEAKAQYSSWAAYKAELKSRINNPRSFFAAVIPAYGMYCLIRCQIDWKFTMKPATDRYGNLIEYYEVEQVPMYLLKTSHIDGSAILLEEFEEHVNQ